MYRWLPGRLAGAVFAALCAGSAILPAGSVAAQPGGPPWSAWKASGLEVLSQSPWVGPGGEFQVRIRPGSGQVSSKLRVQIYERLTTRTDFDRALAGRLYGYPAYSTLVSLSRLPAVPQGGVEVQVPINPGGGSAPAGSLPAFEAGQSSGVFPVRLEQYGPGGAPEGRPLTTFLVYAAGDPSMTGLPRLSVGVVVPFSVLPAVGAGGRLGAVGAGEASRLAHLAAVVAGHQDVPVSLAVSPQTLDSLGAPSAPPAARATLAALASLSNSPDEVLPRTYAHVSLPGLLSAGLAGEAGQQVTAGLSSLSRVFGKAPESRTWLLDGPADPAAVSLLANRGMTQLVLPDTDLSALPAESRQTTFALPTRLSLPGRPEALHLTVLALDPGISKDFNLEGGASLAASRLLAELSMIQTETPGVARGVAVVPPTGWAADPRFFDSLLTGLAGNPLLQPVTLSEMFHALRPAPFERFLTGGGQGQAGGSPVGSLAVDAGAIRAARRDVQALTAVLGERGQAGSLADELSRELLVAESDRLGEAQRAALLRVVQGTARQELGAVTLPRSSSITLTSTTGQIPLTILSKGAQPARVELRLDSQRLIFRAFAPPGGSCKVPTPTTEICELILAGQNTTLKVPVEARSSGVFPLDVSLWTPGGDQLLARDRDTVRSTAVSDVGVILIVLAVVSLAVWWIRDLRHGRRARKLVPPPGFDLRFPEDDPALRHFFETPAPEFPRPPAGGRSLPTADRSPNAPAPRGGGSPARS